MSEKAIFTRVSVKSERERVFSRLVEERAVFTFQVQKKILKGRVYDRQGPALVFDPMETIEIKVSTETIATFNFGVETYFLKGNVSSGHKHLLLDISNDLFKLQRRDNFRLMLPNSYRARFELRAIDLEIAKMNFQIIDLSGGGLNFEMLFADEKLRTGCRLSGIVKIKDEFTKPVVGLVRHLRAVGSMGSGLFRVGIQFEGLSPGDSEEIIALVMKIHREAFSRFKI